MAPASDQNGPICEPSSRTLLPDILERENELTEIVVIPKMYTKGAEMQLLLVILVVAERQKDHQADALKELVDKRRAQVQVIDRRTRKEE